MPRLGQSHTGMRERRHFCAVFLAIMRFGARNSLKGIDNGEGSGDLLRRGKAKVAVGKAIGDAKLEAEGEGEKIDGKIQNAVGGIKDTIRDS